MTDVLARLSEAAEHEQAAITKRRELMNEALAEGHSVILVAKHAGITRQAVYKHVNQKEQR